jgi:hypothetical protein
MNSGPDPSLYYIGWDVGGWNCDKNRLSRDAIVILDSELVIVGKPWRGNLRTHINKANTTDEWIGSLFNLCAAGKSGDGVPVTLAIDTPLGFSDEFVKLVSEGKATGPIGESNTNPYLFRFTERYLFERGLSPLSSVKDMIGSQATKGMHVLSKFAPVMESCGIWTDNKGFSAVEAYPAGCRTSQVLKALLKDQHPLSPADLEDARVCALIAYLFINDRSLLQPPEDHVSSREGWIWIPRDVFDSQ